MKLELTSARIHLIKEALPRWCEQFKHACILDSNYMASACDFDTYELLAGIADANARVFNHTNLLHENDGWKLGYVSYEDNHALHGINETQKSKIGFDSCFFFEPQILLIIRKNSNEIEILGAEASLLDEIINSPPTKTNKSAIDLISRTSKSEYLSNVEEIKEQIKVGDFYELNYCIEFYSENAEIASPEVFQRLRNISPTPFSCYLKQDHKHLLSASPERFLKREKQNMIAQPMKGTIRRGLDSHEDKMLKEVLLHSEKERAENIMIVDLMRNDLARCSETGSVIAKELLGLYTFATVHQLISTITATLTKDISTHEILSHTFPMGSMTGAPKREVIHTINKYEKTARGLFSGSVGYISPTHDFDFNVVIRSIQYNAENHYLSYFVGSAITYEANAEQEYHECLLKTKTMFDALEVKS
ncbi:MAG: anthranilate synthase component I family protein [Bacteroidetes bacterium]|nr:anthranilate synthase component I family protein [Bacteroidota bacterium]